MALALGPALHPDGARVAANRVRARARCRPETREIKGFCLVATALVGGATARTLEKHPGNAVAYDESASGSILAAEAVGPKATLDLALEIQGSTPLSAQTVALLETAEGPTLVGGGSADLSAEQIALAQSRGLTPTSLPGFHAEQTVINGAGELGLTPTSGVATNNICVGRCGALIQELGGTYSGRNFSFPSLRVALVEAFHVRDG